MKTLIEQYLVVYEEITPDIDYRVDYEMNVKKWAEFQESKS